MRFEPYANLFDLVELIADLEELTGLHVDVVSEAGLRGDDNTILGEAREL